MRSGRMNWRMCVYPMVGMLSGCGVTGADPTGTAAMVQFEAHLQQSIEM